MKKIIGWPLAWGLFWLGDLVSKPMYYIECMAWLYPLYNALMSWSSHIQEWAKLESPWGEPTHSDDLE
ncbi:MAG: hypothetical protein CTY12_06280 [Methylotenera sp.]|nr:MAG: hypothetical protein CTY12_06280 [Methylotenera sp.]